MSRTNEANFADRPPPDCPLPEGRDRKGLRGAGSLPALVGGTRRRGARGFEKSNLTKQSHGGGAGLLQSRS